MRSVSSMLHPAADNASDALVAAIAPLWRGMRAVSAKHAEIAMVGAVWLVAAVFFFWRLISHPNAVICDGIVMGADARAILFGLAEETIGYDAFKRPFFSVLAGVPVLIARDVLGFSAETSAMLSFALWSGIATAMFYALVRRNFARSTTAALITACFVTSFSTVTVFATPESYAVTISVMAGLLLLIFEVDRARIGTRWMVAAMLGLVTGFGTLVFPPLLALLLVWFVLTARRYGIRSVILQSAFAGLLGLAVYYGLLLAVFGSQSFEEQSRYVGHYSSVAGLFEWETYAAVLSIFSSMAMVSPTDTMLLTYGAENWSGYSGRPLAIAGLVVLAVIYVVMAIEIARRARAEPAVAAIGALLLVFTAFFAYFNRQEAMLYAVVPLMLIWMIVAWAWGRKRFAPAIFAVTTALFLAVNLAPMNYLPQCRAVPPADHSADVELPDLSP